MTRFLQHFFLLLIAISAIVSDAFAIPDPGDDGSSPAWIISLSTSTRNNLYKVNKPVTVSWRTAFARGCSIQSNNGSASVAVNGSYTITPRNTQRMVVKLVCSGDGGSTTSRTTSFEVKSADYPELVSFTVSPDEDVVTVGRDVTLSWRSENANRCRFNGSFFDFASANGTRSYTPVEGQNKVHLTCDSADGRTSNTITVWLTGAVRAEIITFDVTEKTRNSITVGWFAIADICRLYDSDSDNEGFFTRFGSKTITGLAPDTPVRFTLTCTLGFSDGLDRQSIFVRTDP